MSEESEAYVAGLPEAYRETPTIRDAGSMENLLQGYVNLEQKMGTSLSFPGEDADPEQITAFNKKVMENASHLTLIPDADDEEGMTAFYNKLGRPAELAAYEGVEVKDGAGNVIDNSEYIEGLKEFAHKQGYTAKQFKELTQHIGDRSAKHADDVATAKEAIMAEMKKEWGDSTNARIERVQKLVTEMGGEGAANALGELGGNPVILQMLDKVAEALGEEGSLDKETALNDAQTKSQIEDDISTLKQNTAFMDNKHADHERTVTKINALYEKLEKYKEKAA